MTGYIWFLIGLLAGKLVSFIIYRVFCRTSATLKIDPRNPEAEKWLFDFSKMDEREIHKKKILILKIKHNEDLSQK